MQNQLSLANTIRWNLDDLFSGVTDPKINESLTSSQEKAHIFVDRYKGKLALLSAAELTLAFQELEALLTPLYQVSQYAQLIYSIDTSDETIKALVDKVDTLESTVSNLIVFFNLELGHLSSDIYQKWDGAPALSKYAYQLSLIQKNARYHLSEKEEQMITLKNLSGSIAFKKLYQELTSSFQFEFDIDGEHKLMNGSELRALRHHENPSVRRSAMKLFFSRYEQEQLTITTIFNAILKDYALESRQRGYQSPIQRMNVSHDLDDRVVQVLHDVTTESYGLVNRYYKLKTKILKLDELTLADIYAPMPQAKTAYSFEEAKQIVLDGFNRFDSEFYDLAKRMFDRNRIDAPVLPKKRGGAYCSSSTPDLEPYVMLNFLGKETDIATMAHELGHAIHAFFSSKQTLINYHSILPFAETASVFSEMLITDLLLKFKTDKASQISILTHKLEEIIATSYRQNMFSRFEQTVHHQINEKRLSSSEFCEVYMHELKLMFGDSVSYTPEYQWEWSSIPHMIEVPFYVYAYNFGNLLVMALYQSYLENGADFISGYKAFLSKGSSASPVDMTTCVGVSICDTQFWSKSLHYISRLIDQLEALV